MRVVGVRRRLLPDPQRGREVRRPAGWLRYLVRSFLKLRGQRADGMVVGSRHDTDELFAVQVRANRVTEKVLWPSSAQARETRPQPPPTYADRAGDRPRHSAGRRSVSHAEVSRSQVTSPQRSTASRDVNRARSGARRHAAPRSGHDPPDDRRRHRAHGRPHRGRGPRRRP